MLLVLLLLLLLPPPMGVCPLNLSVKLLLNVIKRCIYIPNAVIKPSNTTLTVFTLNDLLLLVVVDLPLLPVGLDRVGEDRMVRFLVCIMLALKRMIYIYYRVYDLLYL